MCMEGVGEAGSPQTPALQQPTRRLSPVEILEAAHLCPRESTRQGAGLPGLSPPHGGPRLG